MFQTAYVIGGNGFVGTHLVDVLVAAKWNVVVIDPRVAAAGALLHIGTGGTLWALKDTVSKSVLDAAKGLVGDADQIFHLGGSSSVGAAAADPLEDFELTVKSTATVLNWLVGGPRTRVTYISSAAVYGDGEAVPISEKRPIHPISIYGVHKALAEQLLQSYGDLNGIPYSIVRFFSLYGPGLSKQLLWEACRRLCEGDASFGGTGAELRDWLHVDDAVRLMMHAALADSKALVVNGATGVATRNDVVIAELRQALASAANVRFSGESRPGDPRSLVADVTRAHSLGFEPEVSLKEGLADYVRWFWNQTC